MENNAVKNENSQQDKQTLYQRRDIRECLKAAWTLLTTNFKRITKAAAIPTLIIAVGMVLYVPEVLQRTIHAFVSPSYTANTETGSYVQLYLGMLILIAGVIYLYGSIAQLVNGKPLSPNILRAAKAVMAALAVCVAVALACYFIVDATVSKSPTLGAALALMTVAVVFIALQPLHYTAMKYLVETDTRLSVLWTSYRAGLKNYWLIFGTTILVTLVSHLASLPANLPLGIALLSQTLATKGQLEGDPLGLPDNFAYILRFIIVIYVIVKVFCGIFIYISLYYCYASIEARNGRSGVA